ncbi:MAG: hypothetical protein HKM23_05850 [Nitrosopumilus sp.]|nr:hypothetical protein [Nitrosopumilus sp.]
MSKNSLVRDIVISYNKIMSRFVQSKINLTRNNKSLLNSRAILKEGIS